MRKHAPPGAAATLVVLTLVTGLLAVVAPSQAATIPVPDVPRTGISFNGPVLALVMSDEVVYAGGDFTSVTGTNGTVARAGLAAIDLTSGAVTGFRADTDGRVRALALSGTALFVGGEFTTVRGSPRFRLAEVDSTSGALRSMRRDADGVVRALVVTSDRLYVGGEFMSIGGVAQPRTAALTLATRAVDTGFRPVVDDAVFSMAATPNGGTLFVGGSFGTVNDSARPFLASLSPTGSVNAPVFALAEDSPVLSLDTNDSGSRVYAGIGGSGNQVAAFSRTSGARTWSQRADGDVQAVAFHAGNVFFGFHEGFAGDPTLRLLAADATSGALENAFRPTVNSFYGVWSLAANTRGVVAGGEFTSVSGVPAGRLAFFDVAPPPPPPPPPPPVEATAEITAFTLTGAQSPVVAVKPQGGQSVTPTARLTVTLPSGSTIAGVTVLGAPTSQADGPGGATIRFRPRCGSTATCVTSGSSVSMTFRLALTGDTADSAGNVAAALSNPGSYVFRPIVVTSEGASLDDAAAVVTARFVRATRITRFGASPEPMRAGRKATVTGVVSKATVCQPGSQADGCRQGQRGRWTPVKAGRVELYFNPAGPTPASRVTTARTDRQGRFVKRFRQYVPGTWHAERTATTALAGARSGKDLVRIKS